MAYVYSVAEGLEALKYIISMCTHYIGYTIPLFVITLVPGIITRLFFLFVYLLFSFDNQNNLFYKHTLNVILLKKKKERLFGATSSADGWVSV